MIAIGWFNDSRPEQIQAIKAVAKRRGITKVVFDHPHILDALGEAMLQQPQRAVFLVGALSEWTPPADETEEIHPVAWREGLLRVIESAGFPFEFTDLDETDLDQVRTVSDATVIRRYIRAHDRILAELSQRHRQAVKYGRPPFGYRVHDGELRIDPHAAEAVTVVFQMVRDGKTGAAIVELLKQQFPRTSNGRKEQHWDYVKLRRILSKAPLYCRGQVSRTLVLPALAFLPEHWITTTWATPRKESP